jgi:hypothetical protein
MPGFPSLPAGRRNICLQVASNLIHPLNNVRLAMTPKTEGKEEKGSSGLPFINDPGNEDPGSLMDDATVPLNDSDDAGDVGNIEFEEEEEDED